MTILALTGKVKHGLPVLVLHPVVHLAVFDRHIELHLSGRMGVEPHLNVFGRPADVCLRGLYGEQPLDAFPVCFFQHTALRKGQAKNRIIRDPFPVDQLIQNIVVDAKRKNGRCDVDAFYDLARNQRQLAD